MENLKIKVNSEAESKEVQEYLLANGLEKPYNNFTLHNGWVCIRENQILCVCESQAGSELDEFKELDLPQLHDLVVLTRNDLNDANHTDQDGWKWFLTSRGEGYVFAVGNAENIKRWDKSPLDYVDLKPIQKPLTELMKDVSVIKEWLDPNDHYSYHKASVFGHGSGWIEIPSGSEIAVLLDEKIFFWKDKGQTHWSNAMWNDCKPDTPSVSYFSLNEFMDEWEHSKIIWELLPKTAKRDAEETPKCKTPIIDTTQFILDGELAKKAWVNGSKIQISPIQDIPEWEDLNEKIATLDCFQKKWLFRCKPLTIMINGTELKPWNSVQVNYETFQIKIDCIDAESADQSYKAIQKIFCNRSVSWSNN